MRAERFLQIIIRLQNSKQLTTDQLATDLHVSARTILRDMDALSLAGIPIYSARGKHGGWSLLEGFSKQLAYLKPEELQSLLALPHDQVLKDLGITKEAEHVREKLLNALPHAATEQTKTIWERIYIDPGTWREKTVRELPYFDVVQEAVFTNRKIKMIYTGPNQEKKERLIEPLGLVVKQTNWYIVARRDGQFRNYRLTRIISAEILKETFNRPLHFQLKDYWHQSKTDFIKHLPRYDVQVKMANTLLNRVTYQPTFIHRYSIRQDEGDSSLVDLTFQSKEEAVEWLLGFSSNMEVLAPEEVKVAVLEAAKQIVAQYEETNK